MPAGPSRAKLPLGFFAGGWLILALAGTALGGPALPDEPAATAASKTTDVSLPLKEGGFNLGDLAVRIGSDNVVQVERAGFLALVKRVFRADALAALDKAMPTAAYVSLEQVATAGLPCRYESETLEIQIEPKVEQRPRGEITGNLVSEGVASADLIKPALASGYVNMHIGGGYDRSFGEDKGTFTFPAGVFDGAVRFGDVVVEGEFDAGWDGVLVRRGTRAIYDLPAAAVRVTAGDLTPAIGGGHLLPPLAGVRVEKSFQKLQPTRNIRPTGRRSFRVERPSDIEVLLNDRVVRRLKVGPGEYDLDSLPLAAGNNNVKLRIKDDTGREETIDFAILFDRSLLAVGVSEWDVTAGIAADNFQGLNYDYAAPFGSASYRLGLLENLTGEMVLAADRDTANAGLSALLQTPIGLLALDGAASAGSTGRFGWSGAVDMEFVLDPDAAASSLHLGIELQSEQFVLPGGEAGGTGARLRASGSYSQALGETMTGSVSGHYVLADEEADDTFGLALTLNRSLGDGLTMGISGGYESSTSASGQEALYPGLSAIARLSYRLGASSGMTVNLDPIKHRLTTNASTSDGNGVGGWGAQLEYTAEPGPDGDRSANSVETSFAYVGNRFDLSTSHGRDFTGLTDMQHVHHSVALGTAIAFADGDVAIGRPVHSSFAMVDAHPSLKDSKLRVSPSERGDAAVSDGFGPTLISDISPYSATRIGYDVDDLPPGYDIGSGTFDFQAPYKSGYSVTVGSGSTVTVLATLHDGTGKPLALLSGSAFEKQQPDRKITLFTNEEGRLGTQGFGPGEWRIDIASPAAPHYAFSLPPEATGIIDLGDLMPAN